MGYQFSPKQGNRSFNHFGVAILRCVEKLLVHISALILPQNSIAFLTKLLMVALVLALPMIFTFGNLKIYSPFIASSLINSLYLS